LGYWNIRGRAQPIRLLLAYTETEYEQKDYPVGDEWFKEKFNLGLDFPNLPYYIDGDVKITQSSAIIRYLARKNGLCGTTEEEKIIVDMMEHCIIDFRTKFVVLCY
ncbi:glutathione S-transferase Mu, partial [Salmonella sp. s54412]|uniref:glutathione S-transferase Mu n=1 Tax=Salmonella sp. s54412 TaxID=3160128 RepID=UPI00375478C1